MAGQRSIGPGVARTLIDRCSRQGEAGAHDRAEPDRVEPDRIGLDRIEPDHILAPENNSICQIEQGGSFKYP